MCVWCVKVQGVSLSSSYGSQELNFGHQAWQQAPLPIEPARRPISHRTLQTVQQDPAQPFTPPGEQARTILSPTEASKPSQKLDVA